MVTVDSSKTGDVTSVDFIKSRRSPFIYPNLSLQSLWFVKYLIICHYFLNSGDDDYDTEISRSADTMVLIAIGSLNTNIRDKVNILFLILFIIFFTLETRIFQATFFSFWNFESFQAMVSAENESIDFNSKVTEREQLNIWFLPSWTTKTDTSMIMMVKFFVPGVFGLF